MEIVWSKQALVDIEEIGDFIAKDSPAKAVAFIDHLIDSVERLENFPESGPIVPENPIFRQIVHDGYRVIYHLSLKRISIVTVLGPGQLYR